MNKVIILILLLSAFLNIWGLFPNYAFHQKEPGLLDSADHILINFVQSLNPDPYVPPDPFRYGSMIYHFHFLVRGSAIAIMYGIHKSTGYDFNVPQAFSGVHKLKEIYTKDEIYLLQDHLTWVSRFTTALLGVLVVFLTYLIVLKLFKKSLPAYLSALALSIMPLFVRDSHYGTPDIPQLFLILLAFWLSINIWEKPTFKNYFWVGFFIGLQTSLKYFPLSLLPFLYFHFLVSGWRFINKKFLLAISTIFLGYLLGQPYLFVHAKEIWKGFTFQLNWYTPDQLTNNRSLIERILPSYLHFFHLNFAISHAILALPLLIGLIGLIFGLFKEKRVTLAILVIPMFNTIFISLYLAAVYEYLSLPSLPFVAMLIGVGLWQIINLFEFSPFRRVVVLLLLTFVLSGSLVDDIKSDFACSKQTNIYGAKQWIHDNIPVGTKFAYQSGIRFDTWPEALKSEKEGSFSISELQEKGIVYSAIEANYSSPFTSWEMDRLFVPQKIADNQFYNLVLEQYQKQATLIKSFEKPVMCTDSQIFIYKLPQKLEPVVNVVRNFSFNNIDDFKSWRIDSNPSEAIISFDSLEGHSQQGSAYYHYQRGLLNKYRQEWFYYSPPLYSPFINAKEYQKYTLTGFVKQEKLPTQKLPDGYLRLDFYDSEKKLLLTVITPRATGNEWEKLSVTTVSPVHSKFLKIGFQSLAFNDFGDFWIDDIQILD